MTIRRNASRAAVLAVLALLAAARPAAANCGAEGCPLAPRGPETAFGRFSFGVDYTFVEQNRLWDGNREVSDAQALAAEGGIGHVLEQLTSTRTWLGVARARVSDRLLLIATLPYLDRVHQHTLEHHTNFFIPSEWHLRGVGDGTLVGMWTALASPAAGDLTLEAGVKLPTGARGAPVVNGDQPEPPARLGTGSTDFTAGFEYRWRFATRTLGGAVASVPLGVTTLVRVNGRGTDQYRMANEWQLDASGSYPLGRRVAVLAQVNGAVRGRDDVGTTDAEPHSTGSASLYASPGLRLDVVPGVSAFGYYQFRLYEHTNGPQLVAPYHFALGLAYAIGR